MARGRGGFTLIEAATVLGLVGMLVLIALPRIERVLVSRDLAAARASFSTLLLRARTAAVDRRQPIRVEIDSASVWLLASTPNGPEAIATLPLREEFRVIAAASASGFTVQPTGLVKGGTPFTVRFARGGLTDSVQVTGYGRIR